VVLSVTALLRPLQWQSLMLPVLPQSMISFLAGWCMLTPG